MNALLPVLLVAASLAGPPVPSAVAKCLNEYQPESEISTYNPHLPYPPAPRDADSFPGLRAPRGR